MKPMNLPRPGSETGQGLPQPRTAEVLRETRETRIRARLNVDGSGQYQVRSGLPFLDHMLAQLAVHGLFDIDIEAQGDLEIDPHHTVEDTALALGEAFSRALGDGRSMVRMGSAFAPLDESLAQVVVDFSGRPFAAIRVDWFGTSVGGLPVTLLEHFWTSFAMAARCTLHVRLLEGRDDHHRCEAIFKALARALDAASQIDPRRAGVVPSSKGVL